MKKWFCDICGEEINEKEIHKQIEMFSLDDGNKAIIDMHSSCYSMFCNKLKKCIEGEKMSRPQRL